MGDEIHCRKISTWVNHSIKNQHEIYNSHYINSAHRFYCRYPSFFSLAGIRHHILLGISLLWAGLAGWMDMKNNGILSHKIAQILPLNGNSFLLILITAVVGGLVAGFAAMSGSYLRASSKK